MTRSRVMRVRATGAGHVTRRDVERVRDETSGIGPGSSGRRDGVGTGRGTSHNIIDRLTNQVVEVSKTSEPVTFTSTNPTDGPSALSGPFPLVNLSPPVNLSLPTKLFVDCFMCVRVHGYTACVPSFCKKDRAERSQRRIHRKTRLD